MRIPRELMRPCHTPLYRVIPGRVRSVGMTSAIKGYSEVTALLKCFSWKRAPDPIPRAAGVEICVGISDGVAGIKPGLIIAGRTARTYFSGHGSIVPIIVIAPVCRSPSTAITDNVTDSGAPAIDDGTIAQWTIRFCRN
jgi:hypothetical protein